MDHIQEKIFINVYCEAFARLSAEAVLNPGKLYEAARIDYYDDEEIAKLAAEIAEHAVCGLAKAAKFNHMADKINNKITGLMEKPEF